VSTDAVGYAISRPTPDPLRFLPALSTFLGALLVVTIGSFLLARSIVRPLGALASTAKRFGRGDLRARVGLARNDEIGAVGRAFDDMAERIERLVRTEKELLANVSHELRTPLSRIRVALDLANEGDASMAREALSEIALDLEELEGLVDDVLTATRLSIGEGVARPASLVRTREPCDPQAIAARAAERFRIHHEKRDFALELEAPPVEVVGDAALLRRVLDNLLENAEKYSPDPATPIRLRVRYAAPNVIFEVRDRGIGIAEDDLPHLFEPFFRADRSRTRATGGVGLGLTLAKRIVEAHDGEIRVESVKDEGTYVSVVLPARPSID
jgi:signal transduction histidine kinase